MDNEQPAAENDKLSSELLTCPNEGCVKMYQWHSGLEKHLLFGQCKIVPERCTLLNVARKKYHAPLVEGSSEAISAALEQEDISLSANTLPEGCALKTMKTFNHFSDTQKKYLEEKFNLGQATGQKLDPINVARDMRFAKKMDESKLFKRDEYLTTHQVQPFLELRQNFVMINVNFQRQISWRKKSSSKWMSHDKAYFKKFSCGIQLYMTT